MVNTRKSSRTRSGPFISSRTRSSSRNERNSEEHKEPSSDASSPSSPRFAPPSKRTRRQTASEPSSSDTSPSPQTKGQRVSWGIPTYCTRLSSRIMQNGHAHMSHRNEDSGGGDHSHMNGHVELKRSCRVKKSQFEHLNQSLLFDQLVNSTAEAVLQEMDNISSIRQNREVERLRMWTGETEEENMDMYSRVKRRKSMRRSTFNMPAHHKVMGKTEQEEEEEEGTEESHGEEEEEDAEDDDDDDEGDEAEEAGEENDRPYNLRQRKTVQRYEAPPIEPVNRKQSNPSLFDTHRSPARRSHIRVKKHRRKSKSMTRARNRCLPMNLTAEDLASGVLRDRVKVGASLADVDPMNLDPSVRFDNVGGLSNHIQSLKEMVVFPLLYPEIFEKFKIQPPRGCLFYGPPGTGKTLVARALANECSHGDRKVSFFMRKGADCLSKWVGESERQLRLLFDQAYLMRPSIIFFDEIDGLAPVRSSKQDQIHSSIVSTLLALMDGLDSRGEIVVIGATNRLDSIDPALRRPGRFDREFLFSLPDKKARKHILEIHTRDWNPKLSEPFLDELAEKCVGYCGADIKALCTEAALMALRRRYPQIYGSSVKLKLDVASIVLGPGDFSKAMRTIVPASQRALAPPGRALSPTLRPLLATSFSLVLKALLRVFPHAQCTDRDNTHGGDNHLLEEDLYSDDDNEEGSASIYEVQPAASPKSQLTSSAMHRPFLHFSSSALQQPTAYRPRLLLAGAPGSGQSSHLAPALLHHLDKLPVHRLDLPTLYSVSAKTPEESCAQVFREARRSVPSVVYMPHISEWWDTVSDTVKSTFLTLLQDVPSFSPVLVLATAETHYSKLSDEVRSIFQRTYGEVVALSPPGEEEIRHFFSDLLLVQAARPPPRLRNADLLTPAQLSAVPGAGATRKHHSAGEEQPRSSTQGDATEKHCTTNYVKRKVRRRPSWGRGIIRKKKNYKKGTEEEEEEPEAEVETAGPSDSCLTQDEESSCDITGPQPNGHHPHAPSTEEESSNEPPVAAPDKPPDASKAREAPMPKVEEPAPKHTEVLLVSQVDCVNGNESMDSLDLQSLKGSSEAETRTPQSTAEGSNRAEQDEHKDKNKSKPTQEQHPQDGVAVTETVEDDHNKEGIMPVLELCSSKSACATRCSITVRLSDCACAVVVSVVYICKMYLFSKTNDFYCLLQILLDVVVKKSEGYSVEQLERLYSLLSQCIYKHRREYDKTQLLEVRDTTHTGSFETFSDIWC
uniref:ATPase family AAA domain containing 2B n=1 Tax=Neolamprologus brichardi TaxID=32507 RepID=A0A3Q4HV42_NEOBR